MKKIILAIFIFTNIFASSLEQRVELLEQRVKLLETKLDNLLKSQQKINQKITKVSSSQTDIMQKVNNNFTPNCKNLVLVYNYYKYRNAGFISNYIFAYKIKNNFKKEIKYISTTIKYIAKDDNSELLENFIRKDINLKPNKTIVIMNSYIVNKGSLAENLKNIPKKKIKVEFIPLKIEFTDGSFIRCNN